MGIPANLPIQQLLGPGVPKRAHRILDRLLKQHTGWGGGVQFIPTTTFRTQYLHAGISVCPFWSDVAICYQSKTLYWIDPTGTDLDWVFRVCGLIHEMGHLWAAPHSPTKPGLQEFDFWGFEYLLAQQCGISLEEWVEGNGDYAIRIGIDTLEVKQLNCFQLDVQIQKAIERGKVKGNVQNGRVSPLNSIIRAPSRSRR